MPAGVRAQNVNTIDEVPDSSWFTNRIGARALTIEELVARPDRRRAARRRRSGRSRARRARAPRRASPRGTRSGETWFVSFDPPANPEGATGAVVVATKIFWALGYNQVEYFLTELRPDADRRSTRRRDHAPPVRQAHAAHRSDDVHEVLERAHRQRRRHATAPSPAACCPARCSAASSTQGTRPDDPNDLVPHEHRRELRALRVFGAWTNLTDMKAGNTLDTLVTESGRGVVRHYLQDVGSTFGIGATSRTTGTRARSTSTRAARRGSGSSPSASA